MKIAPVAVVLLLVQLALAQPRTIDMFRFDFDAYANTISKYESGFNERSVSRSGLYIGMYQIGDIALKDVGMYPKYSVAKFKRNRASFTLEDQKYVLALIAKKNRQRLGKYVKIYTGKTIKGILITEAGLLGAAHHLGYKAVIRFLTSGGKYVARDGSGVPVTRFLKEMQTITYKQ